MAIEVPRCAAALSVLLLVVGTAACGDDAAPTPDAGAPDARLDGGAPEASTPEASVPDAGGPVAPGTCEAPRPVLGVEGAVTVGFDTTDGPDGALDLGEACSSAAEPRSPQEVIAYTVPGTGPHAILFTTATAETLTNFDTLVQVRTSCAEIPSAGFPPTCFDEISQTDPRSRGAVTAEGGDVLYFVVTGFLDPAAPDEIDRGPGALEITARPNAAPSITGGDLRAIGIRTELEARGTDADGDAAGLSATFLGADGAAVDLDGDGTVPDPLLAYFDEPPGAADSFTGVVTVFAIRVGTGAALLSERLRRLRVASARLRAFDEAFVLSADEVTVPLRTVPEVGFGEACDADHACYLGLRCSSRGKCEATPVVAAACDAAAALELPTPTDTTTSVVVSGTLTNEQGYFEGSCAHSPEVERIYDVVVPDRPVDLLATTDLAGTAGSDTVLYVRSICADLSTEVAGGCNDDISGTANLRSELVLRNMPAGTYALFVEYAAHPAAGGSPFELRVSLRPVLPAGASCDPAEASNRCAAGACPADTSVCP